LNELKQELLTLRVQKVATGAANKVGKISSVRKSIARVLTVINQNQRNALKQLYAKKKYVPLDLRAKKTRALRRELTAREKAAVTERQKKRMIHFPLLKYAIKA
jgi:large subunit ribosomal protein L35e